MIFHRRDAENAENRNGINSLRSFATSAILRYSFLETDPVPIIQFICKLNLFSLGSTVIKDDFYHANILLFFI